MEFRPIASSSDGNAYVVSAPNMAPLLIDCGVRFPLIQEALDFKVTGLAGCLVSHGHGDHCAAVGDLLKSGVNVYGGPDFWSNFKGGIYANHHRAIYLKEQVEERIGPWTVVPFDAVHDAETFGFLVAGGGSKLLYLTDTAWSKYRFEGLTHIVIEANWGEAEIRENSRSGRIHSSQVRRVATTHNSIERVERFLEANDLSKLQEVWLIHLSDRNSDAASFKERIQRITGCPVHVAAKTATQGGVHA